MSRHFTDRGRDLGEVQNKRVMLATPVYQDPDASYAFSISRCREYLHQHGIATTFLLLSGNCNVDDSRNWIVREFLQSDCDELVFLDADVSWDSDALLRLCETDKDIVGGVYPYRRSNDGSSMPVRMLPGVIDVDADGFLEVEGLPTGFMKIKRTVLEKMCAEVEHVRRGAEPVRIPVLFDRDIYEGIRRSGDIRFCMEWRRLFGGKVYAMPELMLGHTGVETHRSTLAGYLRAQKGETISYAIARIRESRESPELMDEVIDFWSNEWVADGNVLMSAIGLARSADGPILETGSGLSTLLMAAATDQEVWCVEHHPVHAANLRMLAGQHKLANIRMVTAGIKGGWYDIPPDDLAVMPESYALAFVDGPPRLLGDRIKFFEKGIADRCTTILIDDADDFTYLSAVKDWAQRAGRPVMSDRRAAVVLSEALAQAAE